MPENTDDIKLIGFLVDNDRDKVRQLKPEKLEEFDRIVGREHYAPMSFYPLDITLKYQREAAKILYGNDGPESMYKMGAWDYRMIGETQLGKVLKALYLKDIRSSAHALPQIVSTCSKGLRIHVNEINDHEIHIVFENDPYTETYFQGFFTEALKEHFKGQGAITVENRSNGSRAFIVKW